MIPIAAVGRGEDPHNNISINIRKPDNPDYPETYCLQSNTGQLATKNILMLQFISIIILSLDETGWNIIK